MVTISTARPAAVQAFTLIASTRLLLALSLTARAKGRVATGNEAIHFGQRPSHRQSESLRLIAACIRLCRAAILFWVESNLQVSSRTLATIKLSGRITESGDEQCSRSVVDSE